MGRVTDSVRAYIGLGSNLNDPLHQVRKAYEEINEIPETRAVVCSSLYRSAPLGPENQPDYINAVVGIETRLRPHGLLACLLEIEERHGRERGLEPWGPRTLDLDLLLYGDETRHDAILEIPHTHLHERVFVLAPLAEIAPGLCLPKLGRLEDLLADVRAQEVSLVATMDEST